MNTGINKNMVIDLWNTLEESNNWPEVVAVFRCIEKPDWCYISGKKEGYAVVSLSQQRVLDVTEAPIETFCLDPEEGGLIWVDVL